MDRTQKWMGSVGCLGQIENIKRQSLFYFSMDYEKNYYFRLICQGKAYLYGLK